MHTRSFPAKAGNDGYARTLHAMRKKMRTASLLLIILLITINLKAQNHKEEWDFYMLNVDDKIASIYLDLGLKSIAPISGKENIFWISIKMNNPREDGLSSQEESSKLWEIEDLIVEQISSNHDVIYVGRLTNNNHRDIYFYFGEDKLLDKTLSECMVRFPNYEYDFGIKENDKWESYLNFLFPSPMSYQSIMNRRVLEHMEKRGDKLEKVRKVDHWIYFMTKEDRNKYELEIKKKGFKITDKNFDNENGEYKYKLVISREDKVSRNEIDDYTIELWELANKLNGDYDGWEAPLIIEKKE
jgi:uncharacterized protein (TIGR01619 family)